MRSRSKVRPAIVLLAAAALSVAGVITDSGSGAAEADEAGIFAVEDDGADCPVSLPGSLPANSRLPDPFTRINGTRITSRSDWRCRRAEIREMAERYVYGDKPAKPASVTGTVSSSNITVNVSHNGRSAGFSASVSLPSGTGPFPAVIVLGGFGADTATIRSAGAAIINYDPLSVGREGTPRNNKQGAFYSIYGATSGTGLLAAWAWGASRIIDVIEASGGNVLRADGVGVTGCSRYGKGALAVGAFDQRIALTMPIESGAGGVPIMRGLATESGAQGLSSAYGEQPWLGDAFGSFTGSPATLPVDMHEVVGMIAPRGLFIMENPHVDWLGARSGSVSALGGAEVYRALGATDNISYWSDVADGTHCASRSEWRTPLTQYIQEFLRKSGNATPVFRISGRKAGNLAEWRSWTTPALSGEPTEPPDDPTEPPDPPDPTDPPAGACRVAYGMTAWNNGFTTEVSITNTGTSAVSGWTLRFTLPSGQTVTSGWNASISPATGAVGATNVTHNATIAPGTTVGFGFQATHNGNTGEPPAFTLNGNDCAVV